MKDSSPHSQGRGTSSQYSAATSTSATSSPKTVETTMYWRGARGEGGRGPPHWGRREGGRLGVGGGGGGRGGPPPPRGGRGGGGPPQPLWEGAAVDDEKEQQHQDEAKVRDDPGDPDQHLLQDTGQAVEVEPADRGVELLLGDAEL